MPKPNETQTKIVYYLQNVGPASVKKLAEVLGLEESQWDEVRAEIRALESAGLVERVPGAFVTYQTPEGGTVTKHMNHTGVAPAKPDTPVSALPPVRRLRRALVGPILGGVSPALHSPIKRASAI